MLKFKKAGDFDDVIYERSGYVARITLNSPETLNTNVKDLGKALAIVEEADDIKILKKQTGTANHLNHYKYIGPLIPH